MEKRGKQMSYEELEEQQLENYWSRDPKALKEGKRIVKQLMKKYPLGLCENIREVIRDYIYAKSRSLRFHQFSN